MLSLARKMDLIATPPFLNIRPGVNAHQTLRGALLTLCLFVVLIWFAVNAIIKLADLTNPQISNQFKTLGGDRSRSIDLTETDQMPIIFFNRPSILGRLSKPIKFSEGKSYSNIVAVLSTWTSNGDNLGDRNFSFKILPFVPCSDLKSTEVYEYFLEDSDYKTTAENYGCLDVDSDDDINIKGNEKSDKFTSLSIIAYPSLETNSSPPQDFNEGISLALLTSRHQVDESDFESPITQELFEAGNFELSGEATTEVDINIGEFILQDITSTHFFRKKDNVTLATSKISSTRRSRSTASQSVCSRANYDQVLESQNTTYLTTCTPFGTFNIQNAETLAILTRTYPQVTQAISDIGGFFASIQGALVVIYGFFYVGMLIRNYGRSIVTPSSFELLLKQIRKSDTDTEAKKTEGDKLGEDSKAPKGTQSDKRQNTKDKKAKELLKTTIAQVSEANSSICTIVKELSDFQLFKNMVFDNAQRKLFSVAVINQRRLEIQRELKAKEEEKAQASKSKVNKLPAPINNVHFELI